MACFGKIFEFLAPSNADELFQKTSFMIGEWLDKFSRRLNAHLPQKAVIYLYSKLV